MALHQAVDDLQMTNHKKIDQSFAARRGEGLTLAQQWWVRRGAYPSSFDELLGSVGAVIEEEGSVIPINLRVNNLQLIHRMDYQML